jgi:hypothetical protein
VLHPAGTVYFDGVRDQSLFEDDYMIEKDGELIPIPQYTGNVGDAWKMFIKWHDIGGTGRLHLNRTTVSATFNHQMLSYGYYGSHRNMVSSRLEWLPMRALSPQLVKFLISSNVDDCTWIDGIEPVEADES